MSKINGKRLWIVAVIVAALIGSISAVGAIEKREATKIQTEIINKQTATIAAVTEAENADTETWLTKMPTSVVYTRSRWLVDLMSASGKGRPSFSSQPQRAFEEAYRCGILLSYTEQDIARPLDRLFVAQTMVRALGYEYHSVGSLTDVTVQQKDMATMAYYGYFLPDASGRLYPDNQITAEEYQLLQTELERYSALKGKHILTFGDSIMHGSGNDDEGIGEIIAQKYGMTATDYSVPGASIGIRENRNHIRDQLKQALNAHITPDVILINGGTNDIYHSALGTISSGFDMAKTKEKDFTPGLEKTFWSIQQNWSGVPVIYIRVHNMNLGPDDKERLFGERAIDVAIKWGIPTVDLYKNTEMNTEIASVSERYTYLEPANHYTADSIHPNALGYAKFYLPMITDAIATQLSKE